MHAIALQWSIRRGDPQANIARAKELLEAASPEPGDIVVLPELWPTGYARRERLCQAAAEHGEEWATFVRDAAASRGIALAGSAPTAEAGSLVNRLEVWGERGLLGYYDKMHLFPPMKEEDLFSPGRAAVPIPLSNGLVVGPVICYDLRFPELFRLLAVRGASVFVLPSEFPDPKEDLWHIFLAARAAENQAYVVACNRTGESGGFTFFGSSAVYDPSGRCLGRLGREEGFLKIPLDPAEVVQARRALPVLSQVRLVIQE